MPAPERLPNCGEPGQHQRNWKACRRDEISRRPHAHELEGDGHQKDGGKNQSGNKDRYRFCHCNLSFQGWTNVPAIQQMTLPGGKLAS
jgi:hypothetical protein